VLRIALGALIAAVHDRAALRAASGLTAPPPIDLVKNTKRAYDAADALTATTRRAPVFDDVAVVGADAAAAAGLVGGGASIVARRAAGAAVDAAATPTLLTSCAFETTARASVAITALVADAATSTVLVGCGVIIVASAAAAGDATDSPTAPTLSALVLTHRVFETTCNMPATLVAVFDAATCLRLRWRFGAFLVMAASLRSRLWLQIPHVYLFLSCEHKVDPPH
jgi:hypothetical protein